MSSSLLKKINQNHLRAELESAFQTESYTGGESLRSNKSFTEWLLSPSLYPSDERILSNRLVARRSSEFRGSFYSLETSRATYTFFCPADAALKPNWPRLKALWMDFGRRYPGRVLGVRFLRTVGELPIWLDDEVSQLRINTAIRNRGEIACLVERRIINRVKISQLSERGFYRDEFLALAELIDMQQSAKLDYQFSTASEPLTSELSSAVLPYELLLKKMSRGITFETDDIKCSDLELVTYEGGTLAWGIKSGSSREEILAALREQFGPSFIEALGATTKFPISNLALSLISYSRGVSNERSKIKRAVKDLIFGVSNANCALVVIDSDPSLAEELAEVFETQLILDSNNIGNCSLTAAYGAVAVVGVSEVGSAPHIVQMLKEQGLRVLTVQKGGEGFGGLLGISPKLTLSDQVIEVLREASHLL